MIFKLFFRAIFAPVVALLILIIGQHYAVAETIIHPKSNDPKENLVAQILQLALSKAPSGIQYDYQQVSSLQTESRSIEMLKEGSMSVMWAGTQVQYEQEMRPIRIPVLKGMLGHRIFIIRKGDQPRFNQITSFADLQRIVAGQGRFWGDTVVLKHAGLNVVTPVKYESLFHMLEGSRFDFFPRAVHEPWSEVTSREQLNLTIENRILLIYPFAMYYFVGPDNEKLATDITSGFRRAINDGSYDQLFFSHPMIKDALHYAKLEDRIVFRLENPNMSHETPVDDASLWLNIDDLKSQ